MTPLCALFFVPSNPRAQSKYLYAPIKFIEGISQMF